MEDDDDPGFIGDFVYDRVQAVRNIAMDLETVKNRTGRDLLKRAGELALQHLALKSGEVVELVAENGRRVKDRPL